MPCIFFEVSLKHGNEKHIWEYSNSVQQDTRLGFLLPVQSNCYSLALLLSRLILRISKRDISFVCTAMWLQ
jgi:hypothetical protein